MATSLTRFPAYLSPLMAFRSALPESLVEGLAKRLAVSRGDLGKHESVEALGAQVVTYRGIARMLLDPHGPTRDAELRLRQTIAHKVYGRDFDKLAHDDRCEIAEEAQLAVFSVLETFAGPKVPLTPWRRESLLLEGDPEWCGGRDAI